MGSYGNAIMAGFICRLCSEQKKCVIHLYGIKARKLSLLKKIQLIPIKVDKYDKLPKTICETCIEKLNMQFHLIQQLRKSANIQRTHGLFHNNGRCPVECPLHGIERDVGAEANNIVYNDEENLGIDTSLLEDLDIDENVVNELLNEIETEFTQQNARNPNVNALH